jgi:hypothetical protein
MPTAWVAGADRVRRAQSFVGVGWWHADIDECDVGVLALDLVQEVVGGADLRGDVDARFAQERGEAVADD